MAITDGNNIELDGWKAEAVTRDTPTSEIADRRHAAAEERICAYYNAAPLRGITGITGITVTVHFIDRRERIECTVTPRAD
jgi:hypothetical protein